MRKTNKQRRTVNLRLFLVTAGLTLVLCSIIGGTVAWLIADTDPVVNTFTYGDINIDLTETDVDGDGDPGTNEYSMLPGNSIDKDPVVTVKAGSEDAWLFVKLEKSANFDDFMTYVVDSGWTPLEDVDGVYYIEVDKPDTDAEFHVLEDDKVHVNGAVTKDMLNGLDDGSFPTLTITAYAVQRDDNIASAEAAWALVEAENANP